MTRLSIKLLFILRLGLTFSSFVWIGIFFYKNRSGILAGFDRLDPVSIFLAFTIVLIGLVPGAWAWQRMISAEMPTVGISNGILIYLRSGIGKYTPGGALSFVIQYKFLKSEGVKTIGLVRIFVGNAVAACVAASLLSTPVILIASGSLNPFLWSLLASATTCVVLWAFAKMHTWPIADGILRKVGLPSPKLFFETFVIMLCAWTLTGTHLLLLASEMGVDSVFLVSTYAFSAIAGILFAILPGALGLRDGAFLAALSLHLPAADAIAIAVLSRTLIVFGDIAGTIIAALILRTTSTSDLKEQSA